MHRQALLCLTADTLDSRACGFGMPDHIDGLADDDGHYVCIAVAWASANSWPTVGIA